MILWFFSGLATVLIVGDWSKVVSDGFRRLELIRLSISWYISRRLVALLGFLWGRWWELETVASHKICWQMGRDRRVWMFILNRKCRLMGRP